jgi:hypothetical protein
VPYFIAGCEPEIPANVTVLRLLEIDSFGCRYIPSYQDESLKFAMKV